MSTNFQPPSGGNSPQITAARRSDLETNSLHSNVSQSERVASTVIGCGFVLYGLTRPGLRLLPTLLGGALIYRGTTGWCNLYQAFGINTAERSEHSSIGPGEGVHVQKTVLIKSSPAGLYRTWRKLENLSQILSHVDSVTEKDARHSHWIISGPLGVKCEWDAEIIQDKPGEMIAWRSLEGADVSSAGSIHFREHGPSETQVDLNLRYSPPAGKVSDTVSSWFGTSPARQIAQDLENFKAHVESQPST